MGEDLQINGGPFFDTDRFLYFYFNPNLVIPGDEIAGFIYTNEDTMTHKVVKEFVSLSNSTTTLEHLINPDVTEIGGAFYKSRGFKRLLEVDNSLVIPYGTNIKLSITSDDVIHS